MRITILDSAPKLLTKQFSLVNSEIVKKDYDKPYHYKYKFIDCDGIDDLCALLTYLNDEPSKCIIRGKLIDSIDADGIIYRRKNPLNEAFACFEENPAGNYWAMCDFDKIEIPQFLPTDLDCYLEYLISLLPPYMHDVSYVYQWSSSAGMDNWQTLRCHIWFCLAVPLTDSELIEWAKSLNTPEFKLLDDSVFRTVQPNYTAGPILTNVVDPVAGQRVGLIRKKYNEALIPIITKPLPVTVTSMSYGTGACTARSKLNRFDERLNDIGKPDYHSAIVKAVGSWKAQTCPTSDLGALKRRLRDAISKAPGQGSAGKAHYMSDIYLDQTIQSCPFIGPADAPTRLPETDKERMAWAVSRHKCVDADQVTESVKDFAEYKKIKVKGTK